MNPIAEELNHIIAENAPDVLAMLAPTGRELFFPRGILSQSAEAKEKAHRFNATAGIAKENGQTMRLNSVMRMLCGLRASEALTYAPSFGIEPLRRLWQDQLYRKNLSLAGKSISLPVVSAGITHGLAVFADLWVAPDDPVILPDPMWGNYNMIFQVRKNARVRQFPIFDERGGFHQQALAKCVREESQHRNKIVVILNFPHNPSGYTLLQSEAEAVERILIEAAESGTRVIAVTDDSYFGLFYEEKSIQESLFARLSGRHPRLLAVKLDGCTKENFVWGLRVGFIVYGASPTGDSRSLYEALEKKTAGCVRGSISNVSHLSQSLVLKSMQDEAFEAEKAEKFEILQSRAARVKTVLADPKYRSAWDYYPFNSGYFMCLKLKTVQAEPLRRHLLERYGVGTIALGERNLRIAFSCVEEEDIPQLFDDILQAVQDLNGGP